MTDRHPVYRLTQEAYDQLRLVAEADPDAYLDADRDFNRVLSERGVADMFEETDITTSRPISLTPAAEGTTPHQADRQALSFYKSFKGMSPSSATDMRLWAWMTHFRLHSYGLKRWRRPSNVNMLNYVRSHWFGLGKSNTGTGQPKAGIPEIRKSQVGTVGTSEALWRRNTASRTWWIAHTAIKAARGSAGAFTAEEALQLFSEIAVFYHALMSYNFTREPVMLGEMVRTLLNEAEGIAAEKGTYALLRELNLIGGTQILPLVSRKVLRELIVENVDRIMSDPDLVSDRKKIRNRKPFRSLSLGAGVQSTVLALMAERGEYELPKPDVAVFADTGWEPPGVYEHLDWLATQLSFEIVRVSAGNMRDNILAGTNPNGGEYLGLPAFLITADGNKAMASRQCTSKYKVLPINRYLRQRMGIAPGKRAPKHVHVEIWLGISADEPLRQKPSREEWATNRYPLIERGFSRAQLLNWFNKNYPGHYLPRSSCIGCPYRSDGEWKWLKNSDPEAFEDAVFIDRALREVPVVKNAITRKGSAYLHRTRVPLSEVNFNEAVDYDSYMAEECEGLCGI